MRLPIRSLPKASRNSSQWICRRCLATTTTTSPPSRYTPIPPLSTRSSPSSLPQKKDASEAEFYDPFLKSSERDYRLTKTDFYLKKPLPQEIPHQYLQHSESPLLHPSEQAARKKVEKHGSIVGVVVSTGKMDKTVRVQIPRKVWNRRIKKVRSALNPNPNILLLFNMRLTHTTVPPKTNPLPGPRPK